MIYKSQEPLEVGKRYDAPEHLLSDGFGNYHHVPFFVLRQSTREEFITSRQRDGIPLGTILNSDFFYDISTD